MNGLTATNVGDLVAAIQQAINAYKKSGRKETVGALEDVLFAMKQLQFQNNGKPSRPDRVGDECWCGTYEKNVGWSWRRGILRAWAAGDCPAIVEDAGTKEIDYFSRISFATEAPS
jgi:hypothetical protein